MTALAKIPRRIIQTAKFAELSPLAKAVATNIRLLHPDWDYIFFDDAAVMDFVAREYPEHQTLFKSFPHRIQRFDLFRYLAVYRLGGFYFDFDVLLWKGLDPLLSHGCVFPFEELTVNRFLRAELNIDWEIGNYGFGAVARHPFLAAVIENCDRSFRDPAWMQLMMRGIPRWLRPEFEILNTTGPGMLTRTLAENRAFVHSVSVLYPADVLDEGTWHQFGSYGTHLMIASWRNRRYFLSRKLGLLWENWQRRRLMVESRRLGSTRHASAIHAA